MHNNTISHFDSYKKTNENILKSSKNNNLNKSNSKKDINSNKINNKPDNNLDKVMQLSNSRNDLQNKNKEKFDELD